jgi:hypothetical protein
MSSSSASVLEQRTHMPGTCVHSALHKLETQTDSKSGLRNSARSEFDPALEGDHARRAVAAETDAEQAGGRGDGALEGAEAGGDEAAGDAGLDRAGQGKVGVVEGVEHLGVKAEGNAFSELELFGDVDI